MMKKRRPDVLVTVRAVQWFSEYDVIHFDMQLAWDRNDPACVGLWLPDKEEHWTTSRDNLITAVVHNQDAGIRDGDVYIEPTWWDAWGRVLLIHLDNGDQHEHVLLPTNSVYRFIGETLQFIPTHEEDYAPAVDELIKRILA